MSQSTSVFVFGNNSHSRLIEGLFEQGLTPILRRTMLPALEKIRHENFIAIFIDCNAVEIDILEFVLNVRDINSHIPIFVIGKPANESENLSFLNLQNVFLLDDILLLKNVRKDMMSIRKI